jgi:hypothetical protein
MSGWESRKIKTTCPNENPETSEVCLERMEAFVA